MSLTDPQARWTCAPGGPAFFAYSTNYLIDVEHGVIVKVEMQFAHLKRILRLDRLPLRVLSGAFDEFTLAATAQNLRRLAKLAGQGPPTDHGLPAPARGADERPRRRPGAKAG